MKDPEGLFWHKDSVRLDDHHDARLEGIECLDRCLMLFKHRRPSGVKSGIRITVIVEEIGVE